MILYSIQGSHPWEGARDAILGMQRRVLKATQTRKAYCASVCITDAKTESCILSPHDLIPHSLRSYTSADLSPPILGGFENCDESERVLTLRIRTEVACGDRSLSAN